LKLLVKSVFWAMVARFSCVAGHPLVKKNCKKKVLNENELK